MYSLCLWITHWNISNLFELFVVLCAQVWRWLTLNHSSLEIWSSQSWISDHFSLEISVSLEGGKKGGYLYKFIGMMLSGSVLDDGLRKCWEVFLFIVLWSRFLCWKWLDMQPTSIPLWLCNQSYRIDFKVCTPFWPMTIFILAWS